MKIRGVEGMSPENIRDEVNRGGRLVIYTYCVSILVMTFKRPTDIRLIKAGHNPAANGLPYVFVSLLFGWWGFPWGPIYTIECIYRNLCGGIDVTGDVLRQILPAGTVATPEVGAKTSNAPAFASAAPPKRFDFKIAAYLLGAVCAVAALGITVYCYQKQHALSVVLASGLDRPYNVTLNGESHTLQPFQTETLELPEGDFVLADAPGGHVVGGEQKFNFSLPFYSHLDTDRVAIINPDRSAILVSAEVPYYSSTSRPPADENAVSSFLTSQLTYFVSKPDFVFVTPDQNISMPSGTTRLVKTRLDIIRKPNLPSILETLTEKSGYPAMRDYLMQLARHRTDESLLSAALQALKPEDQKTFFKLHLGDRPVLVDWHRYYQSQMETIQPDHDLTAEYRAYLQADPGSGALTYLLAREIDDPVEQGRMWHAALAATPPCFYAYGAIGFDALSEGRFAEADAAYQSSFQNGISTLSLDHFRRRALFALGKYREILTELAAARKAAPHDMSLVEEEIQVTYALAHDKSSAVKIKDSYLAVYKASKPAEKDLADADAFLQSGIAYLEGDLPAYTGLMSRFDFPFYRFRAAFTAGSLKDAAKVVSESDADGELLLYLLAHRTGDVAAADLHFKAAHKAMKNKDRDFRQIAGLLDTGKPDASTICSLHINIESKRILLTALGVKWPADRETYFGLAKKLNFNTDFPHQFLRSILTP